MNTLLINLEEDEVNSRIEKHINNTQNICKTDLISHNFSFTNKTINNKNNTSNTKTNDMYHTQQEDLNPLNKNKKSKNKPKFIKPKIKLFKSDTNENIIKNYKIVNDFHYNKGEFFGMDLIKELFNNRLLEYFQITHFNSKTLLPCYDSLNDIITKKELRFIIKKLHKLTKKYIKKYHSESHIFKVKLKDGEVILIFLVNENKPLKYKGDSPKLLA